MQAMLVPMDGGRPIRLEKEVTVVGRRRWVCDICFDDRTVSKFHCLIMKARDGMFYVRDLGSANGTMINGKRVTEEALLHGDELAVAHQRFRLQMGETPIEAQQRRETPEENGRIGQTVKIENPVAQQNPTIAGAPQAIDIPDGAFYQQPASERADISQTNDSHEHMKPIKDASFSDYDLASASRHGAPPPPNDSAAAAVGNSNQAGMADATDSTRLPEDSEIGNTDNF